MAYPPPVLPINRTNSTPSQDTHPQDHNLANQAINDTVTFATAVNVKVDNLGTTVSKILHPPAETAITYGSTAVNSAESSLGTFPIAVSGLYIVGYSPTIATGSGYGFVDFQLKANNGTTPLAPLLPTRWFEAPRQTAYGLTLAELTAGDTVHIRAKTFAGTVTVETFYLIKFLLRSP